MITIFLADDHGVLRDSVRLLLESQPAFQIVGEADNGRDAVAEVARLHPDIVLLDIAMPQLNGIDATAAICAQTPGAKVIILSMYGTQTHLYHALRAGAWGFVAKEAAGRQLIEAVQTVSAGRPYFQLGPLSEEETGALDLPRLRSRPSPFEALSKREREVMQLVVEGMSSAAIARLLQLSPKTVETYRSRAMHKLGVRSHFELLRMMIEQGLTPRA
jgi:DNA-binding NarL/FixJ family response regulator